jgi:hypothetical protein
MGARRERSLRAMLAGSLVFWGLAAVSVSAVTALTTEAAAASSTTLWSSTTPGTYTVTGLPSGVPLTITAVGGSGGTDPNNGFAGGEGAIVTTTFTLTGGESLQVIVGADGADGDASDVAGGVGAGTGGSSTGSGGGGGGGSAVFNGSTPIVVAGGGGGSDEGVGGNADQNGEDYPSGGGGAGTLSGPGSVGTCSNYADPGSGMNGGSGNGGGGGGGYFGGGGACDGGGGGGSSYPAAATQWDATATPSVTIATSVFCISTISLPSATPGKPYGPVTFHAVNIGASTSPHTTKVTWAGIELPPGLTMSSAGVLSGTPSTNLIPGLLTVVAYATETVTTVSGKKVKKKKTTTQATIPIAIE